MALAEYLIISRTKQGDFQKNAKLRHALMKFEEMFDFAI